MEAKIKEFESRAKLMVSGEYAVLKGALSLALPLKFGQKLSVIEKPGKPVIRWKSMIHDRLWISATISLPDFRVTDSSMPSILARLCKILVTAKILNNDFLASGIEYEVTSVMDFEPDWGIGSGSSLVSNIAHWANCDPFELNKRIFNGSGYDIACARASGPIIYNLQEGQPFWRASAFDPPFSDQLYFVYLNCKQNTQKSIRENGIKTVTSRELREISLLTLAMEKASDLPTFSNLMDHHEEAVGRLIDKSPVRIDHFKDFEGSMKSLGAWGGDFILAASTETESSVRNYFDGKNYPLIFRYDEIVHNKHQPNRLPEYGIGASKTKISTIHDGTYA